MEDSKNELKVLDCRAGNHDYLHRDFHGALCYSIKYLDEKFGPEATREYLTQIGQVLYAPLTASLREGGLAALEDHWRKVFGLEGGKYQLTFQDSTLVLTVEECPAIEHLIKTRQLFTERYCQTTVVVNDVVCRQAGYSASCEYQPGQGKCIQRFWKAKVNAP